MTNPNGIAPLIERDWDYFDARPIDRREAPGPRAPGLEHMELSMWYPGVTEPGLIFLRQWYGKMDFFNAQAGQLHRLQAINRIANLGLRSTLNETGLRHDRQDAKDMRFTDHALSLPSHQTQIDETARLAREGRLPGGNRLGFMLVNDNNGQQPPRQFVEAARDYQTPIATVGEPAFILHDVTEHGPGRLAFTERLNDGVSLKADTILEAAGSDADTPDIRYFTSVLNGSSHVFDVLDLFDGKEQQIENWMYLLDTDAPTVQMYAAEAQDNLIAYR